MGLSAIASRLIVKHGESGQFERPGAVDESTYPPVFGDPTYHPAKIAVVNYEIEDRNGTNIQATHMRALTAIAGLGIEPSNSDKLLIGDRSYSIVNVETITRKGVAVFYDIQVVRA